MAQNLFPGISTAGTQAAEAARNPSAGRAVVSGMKSSGGASFGVDTKDLTTLHKLLTTIDSDLSKIDATVIRLGKSLAGIKATGSGTGGGSGSTTALVSSPATGIRGVAQRAKNALFGNSPGGGGGGGGLNTAAGFSGGIGFAALAEVSANMAGRINTVTAGIFGGSNVDSQLIGYQQAAQYGGTGNGNSRNYAGINAFSTADRAAALTTYQSNPFLAKSLGGKNLTTASNYLNAVNPNLGAAGAASMLSTLTSAQATMVFNRVGLTQGAITNFQTGKLNSPSSIMANIVQGIYGQKLTAAQMKSDASNPSQLGLIQQSALGSMLNPAEMQTLLQYMSGGSLSKSAGNIKGSLAAHQFKANASISRTSMEAAVSGSGASNALSDFTVKVQKAAGALAGMSGLVGGGTMAGKVVSGGLQAAQLAAELKVLKTLPGGGKSGILGSLFKGIGKALTTKVPIPGGAAADTAVEDVAVAGGDPDTGSNSTGGLSPMMAQKVNAMRRANPNIKITSGHRSSRQQSLLYALKGGKGVARPGHSQHELGKAADLGPTSQHAWIAANAHRYGLYAPDPKSEPWHVQGDPGDSWNSQSSFAADVLKGVGVRHPSSSMIGFVNKWENAEGGNWNNTAKYNPLNTSLTVPGSVNYSSGAKGSGVQAYGSASQGLAATISTLKESQYYSSLVKALKGNSPSAANNALIASPWDAGHYNGVGVLGGSAASAAGSPYGGVAGGLLSNGSLSGAASWSVSGGNTSSGSLAQLYALAQANGAATSIKGTGFGSLSAGSTLLGGAGDPYPSVAPTAPMMSRSQSGRSYAISVSVQHLHANNDAEITSLAEKLVAKIDKLEERSSVGSSL